METIRKKLTLLRITLDDKEQRATQAERELQKEEERNEKV